jgi:hypothetical protein
MDVRTCECAELGDVPPGTEREGGGGGEEGEATAPNVRVDGGREQEDEGLEAAGKHESASEEPLPRMPQDQHIQKKPLHVPPALVGRGGGEGVR